MAELLLNGQQGDQQVKHTHNNRLHLIGKSCANFAGQVSQGVRRTRFQFIDLAGEFQKTADVLKVVKWSRKHGNRLVLKVT